MLYLIAVLSLSIISLLQHAARLPPWWLWLLPLAAAGLLAFLSAGTSRRWLSAALLTLGLMGGWAQWQATARLASSPDLERYPQLRQGAVELTGTIIDIPQRTPQYTRILLRLDTDQLGMIRGTRLQLTRHEGRAGTPGPSLLAGQQWQLRVRLKPAHGALNPGGHDREAWLWAQGIRATGSIRHARLLGRSRDLQATLARLRAHLSHDIQRHLAGRTSAGLIAGLVVGDSSAIPQLQWQTYNATATVHLLSISGLHITLVAAQSAWLALWLWQRHARAVLWLPARRVAALAGLLAAAGYALLAGFSVPTQRTLFMVAALALGVFFWRLRPLSALCLALILVLVHDPFAVLSVGLWLSFGAVLVMTLGVHGQIGQRSWLAESLRAQGIVTLALLPASLALAGQQALSSPLANALAIPLISIVVTPLALLGSACMAASALPLQLAERVASWLLPLLQWLEQLGYWQIPMAPWRLFLLSLAGVLLLALPRGIPGRSVGALLLLPLLSWRPPPLPEGGWQAQVLDVGQGLAVLLQTRGHALLYDAGPDWPGDGDSGARTVLPALRAAGVRQLDLLVLSHNDLDHTGGAASIVRELPVRQILGQLPPEHALRRDNAVRYMTCTAGQQWRVDGVVLRILGPEAGTLPLNDNDRSCVLQLEGKWASLLLPGDISAVQERQLVRHWDSRLRSTAMLAPHHGSNSSSSMRWISAVQAQEVIFASGYLNQFRHPHPAVRERHAQSRQWRTDLQGAITLRSAGVRLQVQTEADRRRRFWRNAQRITGLRPP